MAGTTIWVYRSNQSIDSIAPSSRGHAHGRAQTEAIQIGATRSLTDIVNSLQTLPSESLDQNCDVPNHGEARYVSSSRPPRLLPNLNDASLGTEKTRPPRGLGKVLLNVHVSR